MKTRLRDCRELAGFTTAKSFADHMGIKYHTYMNYEQGTSDYSIETACKFADELGVSVDELLGRMAVGDGEGVETLSGIEARIVIAYRQAPIAGRRAIEAVALSQEGLGTMGSATRGPVLADGDL